MDTGLRTDAVALKVIIILFRREHYHGGFGTIVFRHNTHLKTVSLPTEFDSFSFFFFFR